jgi:hypothetical protein
LATNLQKRPLLIVALLLENGIKAIAFDCGFSNENAKQFGKLSKTATWKARLETYGVPFPVDNSSLDTEDTEDTEESD